VNLDPSIGLVEAALRAALDLLERRLVAIVRLVSEGGTISRSDALAMARARSALDELQGSALGSIMSEALGRKRTALEAIAEQVLSEGTGYGFPDAFTQASKAVMDALYRVSDTQIRQFAGDATEEAARYLMQTVISGGPADGLLDKIASTIGKRKDQAESLAETVVSGFHRQLTIQRANEAGIELFAYVGQDDDLTREWCSHWVGRSGTAEEFEATANMWDREKQPMPVMAYGGGWRCRHDFTPLVTQKQIDRYPRGPK
jgi:hypothetical protein